MERLELEAARDQTTDVLRLDDSTRLMEFGLKDA